MFDFECEFKFKICLCTIGKHENKYIVEFIQHNKNFGVDKIYIYLYDNTINYEDENIFLRKRIKKRKKKFKYKIIILFYSLNFMSKFLYSQIINYYEKVFNVVFSDNDENNEKFEDIISDRFCSNNKCEG